jgi:hypothetical protein
MRQRWMGVPRRTCSPIVEWLVLGLTVNGRGVKFACDRTSDSMVGREHSQFRRANVQSRRIGFYLILTTHWV